jgi:hypothetical protein
MEVRERQERVIGLFAGGGGRSTPSLSGKKYPCLVSSTKPHDVLETRRTGNWKKTGYVPLAPGRQ